MSAVIDDESEIEASRAPLMDHLVELRTRLVVCIVALSVACIVSFLFAKQIYVLLLHPFVVANSVMAAHKGANAVTQPFDILLTNLGLKAAPTGISKLTLQNTGPLEFFSVQLKLALFSGIVLAFPILAFQLYRFVSPGLYRRERKAFLPFLIAAPVLFVVGAAFVYFVMLPFVLWFSLSQQIVDANVQVIQQTKTSDYLDFVTKLVLAFGLCFQLPVVVTLLGLAGILEAKTLASGRRYALLGILVVSAVVTPPDMISPFLLAAPIYGLYEASIWCVRLIELRRKREEAAEAA